MNYSKQQKNYINDFWDCLSISWRAPRYAIQYLKKHCCECKLIRLSKYKYKIISRAFYPDYFCFWIDRKKNIVYSAFDSWNHKRKNKLKRSTLKKIIQQKSNKKQ